MNRLVIIGNGFDLAHGLKTGYTDFLEDYWEQLWTKLYESKDRELADEFAKFHTKYKHDTFQDLRNQHIITQKPADISYIDFIKDSDIWRRPKLSLLQMEFESELFKQIWDTQRVKGWVDVEEEYYRLLKGFAKDEKQAGKLNEDLVKLREKLVKYLERVASKVETNPYIGGIIHDQLKEHDVSVTTTNELKRQGLWTEENLHLENVMLLSFNYTITAKIYQGNDITVNYIHGQLSNPDGIIFGYGDELDGEFKNIISGSSNEILRNIKSVKYLETDNYRKLLSFIESEQFQIYVMGHSCGNSDRTLLNTLFEHKNCVSIKPFYHKKPNGKDNYSEIVQNIYRNFTDQKLMRDRVVNKTYCEPLPQSV